MLLNSVTYFRSKSELDSYYDRIVERSRTIEAYFARQSNFKGYCDCCKAVVDITVDSGVRFGKEVSLRAGCICPNGLNNRARLLLRLINEHSWPDKNAIALFEHGSALHSALAREGRYRILSSEYFGEAHRSGEMVQTPQGPIRHENLTASSYASESVDLVVHNDVLEHVPEYGRAFPEALRILKHGGMMIFTTPFFVHLEQSEILAHYDERGQLHHNINPPEYHGDSIRGQILAFYHFGWDMVEAIGKAGFWDVRVVMNYDPFSGIFSDNHPVLRGGNMPPIAFLAQK